MSLHDSSMILRARDPVPLWCPREPDGTARLAFSTRRGGISEPPYDTLNLGRSTPDRPESVEQNRRRLLASLDFDPDRVATAGQVHGVTVTRVSAPGLHRECDALVTTETHLPLAVTGADCLPILYVVPGAVAAAHAGWRGAAEGIATATLRAVCDAAATGPDRVQVHLGPCIRSCCYVVGPEVARRFPAAAVQQRPDGLRLSLPDVVRIQLIDAGVSGSAIADTGACTACESDWYFSHRRDRGLTGRQWGVAGILA
jgi:YfiH family protein